VIKQPEKTLTPEELRARREARVERQALGSMPELWDRLVDLYGRPMPFVRALSPERAVGDFPRLAQLRWFGDGTQLSYVSVGGPALGASASGLRGMNPAASSVTAGAAGR
jgi:hypothetical protein